MDVFLPSQLLEMLHPKAWDSTNVSACFRALVIDGRGQDADTVSIVLERGLSESSAREAHITEVSEHRSGNAI